MDVVEQVEEDATGSFSIRIHSPKVESFERYYFSLNPINNTKNPWFREFWQQKFKCQLTVPKDDTVTPVCTGKENLTMNYEQVGSHRIEFLRQNTKAVSVKMRIKAEICTEELIC